ncbi:MAG: hypothetical protein IT578_09935 [Verrucomicrobiae bacterium]|nr:hypothetical protein [Verrucomicrobiae bacterium]
MKTPLLALLGCLALVGAAFGQTVPLGGLDGADRAKIGSLVSEATAPLAHTNGAYPLMSVGSANYASNVVAGTYPVFILELGDNWTDFELKASTNAFTEIQYFYVSSLTNATCDDPDPRVYFTDSGNDPRAWRKQTAHQSILSQLTDTNSIVRQVVVYPSLLTVKAGATNSSSAWMTATNSHLIWSYVRFDGVDYEKDPSGRQIWTPIVPVQWGQQRTTLSP